MYTDNILFYSFFPLILGWLLDLLLGDPKWMPHPVVYFGSLISKGEHTLNKGSHRKLKGGILAIGLVLAVYSTTWLLIYLLNRIGFDHRLLSLFFQAYIVFASLAGTTLILEVWAVFSAVDRSLEAGRKQVARIVGRDTSELSAQEVRTAALETLAENLSDGVIAPLFWFALLGVPGMLAYKMVNTLDSMIGYHTERYLEFGCVAARVDDVANYIPARLTAMLIIIGAWMRYPKQYSIVYLLSFVKKYGRKHASPNSGYPESALAGILNCRFGGPHYYFGEYFPKPYIGENERELNFEDMRLSVRINRISEILMILLVIAFLCLKVC